MKIFLMRFVFAAVLLLTVCASFQNAFAQPFQWVRSIGTTNTAQGNDVATDDSGNVYMTGTMDGIFDFDTASVLGNLSTHGFSDIFLVKYNRFGNIQWGFTIGGANSDAGTGVTVDDSNNVYITGVYVGSGVNFDPLGSAPLFMSASTDAFVAKYNNTGHCQWAFTLGGTGNSYGKDIRVDHAYNIYLSGTWKGPYVNFNSLGFDTLRDLSINMNVFIAKYHPDRHLEWVKGIGEPNSDDMATSLSMDEAANTYMTGYCNSIMPDMDPGPGTSYLLSGNHRKFFLVKFDSAGTYVWHRSALYQGGNTDLASATLDPAGNVYVSVAMQGDSMDFDPGPASNNFSTIGGSWWDMVVIKYDTAGTYQFAFHYRGTNGIGYNYPGDVITDSLNNFYVCGLIGQDSVDMDPGPGIAYIHRNSFRDFFVAKYSSSGTYLWSFHGGGSMNESDAVALTVSRQGDLLVTGYCSFGVDWDPGPDTVITDPMNSTLHHIFIASYGLNTLTGIPDILSNSQWVLYPNPVHDRLHLYTSYAANNKLKCRIYDATGRLVKTNLAADASIDVSYLAPGLYFIKTESTEFNSQALPFLKE